ncbi:MAG: hypothetical protein RIF32_01670 [Leptospirales bacterium]|jgi:hypothetical protein
MKRIASKSTGIRARFVFAILAVGFAFAGCQTVYDTKGEFKESLGRIKKGQGKKEVAIIMRDFNEIPAQFQDEAVENIDAVEGEVGQKSLIALINDPRVRDDGVRADIASRLIKRDEEGSLEALLVACQNRPNLVNAEIIEYFGENQYAPAIPLLQKQIAEGNLVAESVVALVAMEDPAATLYLLTLAADKEKPEALRLEMFQLVGRLGEEDESIRAKAVPVYEAILKNSADEPVAVVKLAIDGLTRWGDAAKTLGLLRDIYENSESDALRAEALIAMARLRGVSPDVIEKEYATAMVDMDAQMELMRRQQEKKPDVVEKKTEPRPVRKAVRRTKGYGADYRQRLGRRLDGSFGPDLSTEIQKIVNNALLSYAGWSDENPSTRFVLRSYSKHFGGDDAEQRERLKEGLNYPGSLSVIIKNVIAEYKNDDLRAYAITQFFSGIKRWQATILLDLVKKGRI